MAEPSVDGLVLEGVGVSYGDHPALRGVSLTVAPGQVVALLGPNGAGKSTLVSTAAGLRAPGSGTVRVCGADPAQDRRARRRLGLAPQDIGIYPSLSVSENLRAAAELQGMAPRVARQRARAVLGPLELSGLENRQAGRLSGGEQRRVHTAMALVHQPTVVLLDEPTAGADTQTRASLLAAVRDLAEGGAAVVYCTHYLPEVENLGADVAVVERGRIIALGALDQLIARHARSVLELVFSGPPPAWLEGDAGADGLLRIACDDPSATLATTMGRLGADASRLDGVRIVRPSLEAAYLSLTGRRLAQEEGAR